MPPKQRSKSLVKGKQMIVGSPTSILKAIVVMLRSTLLSGLVILMPIVARADEPAHNHASPSKLVQIVRQNTAQFIDVNNVKGAGYQPLFGCVSGPDHGAMGIHYL